MPMEIRFQGVSLFQSISPQIAGHVLMNPSNVLYLKRLSMLVCISLLVLTFEARGTKFSVDPVNVGPSPYMALASHHATTGDSHGSSNPLKYVPTLKSRSTRLERLVEAVGVSWSPPIL